MEAKNKAIELVEKFGDLAVDVVDEILLAVINTYLANPSQLAIWQSKQLKKYEQVKKEIINLKQ